MRVAVIAIVVVIAAAAGGLFGVVPAVGSGVEAVAAIAAVAAVVAVVIVGGSADRVAYIAVSLVVLVMNWNGIRFAGGAVADAFLVAAFLAVVAVVITEKRPVPLPPWMLIAGVGLLVAALLTMVFPPNAQLARSTQLWAAEKAPAPWLIQTAPALVPRRSDTSALLKFEIAWLALPLMIAATATTERRCTRLLDLFAFSAVVSAAVAVLAFAHIAQLTAVTDQRAVGLTLHANYLALSSVLALPLALLWFRRGGPGWSAMGVIGVSILLGGVYASGSRAGSVAAVIAVLATVLVVPQLRPGLPLVFPVMGMLLILVLLFTRTGQHVLQQIRLNPGNSSALASNHERSLIHNIASKQIRSRPLEGVGFAVIEDSHDLYLQLLAAGGVIAFASFAIYIAGVMSAARRVLRGIQRPEVMAAIVSISVWLLHGFFDAPLIDKRLYVIPGVLVAMSSVALRKRSEAVTDLPAERVGMRPPVGREHKLGSSVPLQPHLARPGAVVASSPTGAKGWSEEHPLW